MAKNLRNNWGDWLARRAEVVGFKRQKDFADSVGCSREQLTRWLRMTHPPKQMRKGFDKRLARALQTTPHTLFVEFVDVHPKDAVRLVGQPFQVMPGTLSISPKMSDQALFDEVFARLYPSELEKVLEYAILLVRGKFDHRSAEFDRYFRAHPVSRPLSVDSEA